VCECVENEDCDDGLFCTVDTCDIVIAGCGVCEFGGSPCDEGQTCDEETDTCVDE